MFGHLKRVGWIHELRHGSKEGGCLREAICSAAQPDENRIVEYLRSGNCLAATGSPVCDVLDANNRLQFCLNALTDGVWEWPSDFAYYVEKYHAVVPEDFVEHMRANGWRVPNLTEQQLMQFVPVQS